LSTKTVRTPMTRAKPKPSDFSDEYVGMLVKNICGV